MSGLISIVVPVFNEAGNIKPLFERLRPLIENIKRELEREKERVRQIFGNSNNTSTNSPEDSPVIIDFDPD